MKRSLLSKIYSHVMSNKSPAYLGENKAIVKTIHRIKLIVNTNDISLTPHILIDRQWEPIITKFIRRTLHSGENFIEVGANIGYFTTLAAKIVGNNGHVFSFEANPEAYEFCLKNIEINGFSKFAKVFNFAVTEKKGIIKFNRFSKHQANSSIAEFTTLEDQAEIEEITVNTISLDDFIDEKKIDFIKIDAEGSEGLIFDGMENIITQNSNIKILCEFFPKRLLGAGTSPESFLNKIENLGFQLKIIEDNSLPYIVPREKILSKDFCELFLCKK